MPPYHNTFKGGDEVLKINRNDRWVVVTVEDVDKEEIFGGNRAGRSCPNGGGVGGEDQPSEYFPDTVPNEVDNRRAGGFLGDNVRLNFPS